MKTIQLTDKEAARVLDELYGTLESLVTVDYKEQSDLAGLPVSAFDGDAEDTAIHEIQAVIKKVEE